MLELSDEDFKAAMIKMIHRAIMSTEMKRESLSKKIENTKQNRMEISELKSTISIINNSMNDLNSRMKEREGKDQ